jgi:hypothetical protein
MIRRGMSALLAFGGILVAMSGPATADVVSNFNSSDEGWTIVSFGDLSTNDYSIVGTYTPNYIASGGNPGGYIQTTDPDGGDFTFSAPTSFLGNQSAATGLSYDLLYLDTVNYQTTDVMLVGNGERLLYHTIPPFVPGTSWLTNSLSFSPSASWTVGTTTGAAATTGDFQNVLSDLTGIYIRGEYAFGPDNTGLDNVVLIGGSSAVPEPGSLTLMTIALVTGTALMRRGRSGSAA